MPAIRNDRMVIPSLDGIPLDALVQAPAGPNGSVLLAHGFAVDLHEEGAFDTLAEALIDARFAVLRFSFRGHGASGGTQIGMTIAGERLDLSAAYAWMTGHLPGPYALLGASFGGVSTTLQLASLRPAPRCLVLWNPALEISEVLGADLVETARAQGYVQVRESYRIGQVFAEERALYSGNLGVQRLGAIPTLIVHGSEDALVPIASSRRAAEVENVELVVLEGAAHGFHDPHWEAEAVRVTVAWVERVLAASG